MSASVGEMKALSGGGGAGVIAVNIPSSSSAPSLTDFVGYLWVRCLASRGWGYRKARTQSLWFLHPTESLAGVGANMIDPVNGAS